AKLVTCSRCHGHCVAGTRFCKYCGAPLDDPQRANGEAAPHSVRAQPSRQVEARPAAPALDVDRRPPPPPRRESPAPFPRPVAAQSAIPAPAPTPRHVPEPETATVARPRAGRVPVARLTVIVEDGSEGRSFTLDEAQVDVGRTDGTIRLEDDPYVSPRHARFVCEGSTWIVRDLHSLNGVYTRVRKPHLLRDGDLLLLGLEVLQFQTVSDAERGLGPATQHGVSLFGSPAASRRARLMQRTVEGIVRDVYHVYRDETVIGREVGDIVFTSDPFLSRRHAALRRNPTSGAFTLTDLESSNGTFVAVRGEAQIAHGDFLRIGQHLFRVDLA
ncbi:MAG TPA: FHA domain-containing protein, partial [Byssovorax sp.]